MTRLRSMRSIRSTNGAAAVEFALILGPFCVVLMGMIDYGWYFFVDLACTNAVRTGARNATTVSGAVQACSGAASLQGTQATKAALQNLMPQDPQYAASANCVCAPGGGPPAVPQYQCTIGAPFTGLTGFTAAALLPAQIQTASTMR